MEKSVKNSKEALKIFESVKKTYPGVSHINQINEEDIYLEINTLDNSVKFLAHYKNKSINYRLKVDIDEENDLLLMNNLIKVLKEKGFDVW